MTDVFNRDMLDILPFGIGYLKPLINSRNEAEDYTFIEINAFFEALSNLDRKDVLGKSASGAFRTLTNAGFDWVSYFNGVLRTGRKQEATQWIESLGRSLNITAVPSERKLLALVIQDVAGLPPAARQNDGAQPPFLSFEEVFNRTHDAISVVEFKNGAFRFVRNNAVHKKLTGFSDIRGLTPADLVGSEVGQRLENYYAQCVSTGRSVSYEQIFDFAPGRRVWRTEVTPVSGDNGSQYLLCTSKDISEYEEARGENEGLVRRLQSMFNQHSAIMLISDPVSGRIVDANPAACDFYGYTMEEIHSLGAPDISMLPAKKLKENRENALRNKSFFAVVPHRLKNGTVRLVDVYTSPIDDGRNKLLYSIVFDATDRERYRHELFREKEILRTTLSSIGDGVVTTDNAGIITSLNGMGQEITGWEGDAAAGRPFSEVFVMENEETGLPVENPIQKVLDSGCIVGLANHTMLLNRQGQLVPIADSAAPIKAGDGKTFGVVMVFRDVSLEKEYNRHIRFLSNHDSLTGLYNRRYVEETLNAMDSPENLPLCFVMGDVNGLKITNDVFGHEAGDALLMHVAEILGKNCRKRDLIARWGGDEFAVLMPGTSLETAESIIENIKAHNAALGENSLRLSLSFGCAIKETADQSIRAVMREAEENMYHQKLLEGTSYRNAIINTLLATLYEKSIETEEHSKRMEANCHSIGHRLQLSSKEMDELSLLAFLHDIGKVGINPNILKKPSLLTPAEAEEMKRHPEIGYRIVQATPELATVAELILSHHERWDGAGYPRGLCGKEIPLLCRILAVTDAYDAMTNDRDYRSAISHEEALFELERNSGTQFDPEIVTAFIQTMQSENKADGARVPSEQRMV